MMAMAAIDGAPEDKQPPAVSLRRRLLYCAAALLVAFLVCFFFAHAIFELLARPVADAMHEHNIAERDQRMIFTSLTEVFFTYVKVAFFAAVFLCLPFILTQGLLLRADRGVGDKQPRSAFLLAALALPLLLGGALAYYVIFPAVLDAFFGGGTAYVSFAAPLVDFFISFQAPGYVPNPQFPTLGLDLHVDAYLTLLTKLIFVAGLLFQLPVALALWIRAARPGKSTGEQD